MWICSLPAVKAEEHVHIKPRGLLFTSQLWLVSCNITGLAQISKMFCNLLVDIHPGHYFEKGLFELSAICLTVGAGQPGVSQKLSCYLWYFGT